MHFILLDRNYDLLGKITPIPNVHIDPIIIDHFQEIFSIPSGERMAERTSCSGPIESAVKNRTISTLFFFNDTSTTEIYTLSVSDAIRIYSGEVVDLLE